MNITLEKQEETNALVYKFTTSRMKLARQISQTMEMVKNQLDKININPIGAPFVAYYNMDSKNLEVAIGYPIATKIASSSDLTCITIPEGKAVVSIHEGSYMRLSSTYKKMTKWISANHLEPLNLAYEYYLNSPNEVKTKQLQTKVMLFVK